MTLEEMSFITLLRSQPGNLLTFLVYADWLQEHDETKISSLLREYVALVRSYEGGYIFEVLHPEVGLQRRAVGKEIDEAIQRRLK